MSTQFIHDAEELEQFCISHSKGQYRDVTVLCIKNPAGEKLSIAFSVLREFEAVHTDHESKQILRAMKGAGVLAGMGAIAAAPVALGVAMAYMVFGGFTAASKKHAAREKLESTPLSHLAAYLDDEGFRRGERSVEKIYFHK